MSTALLVAYHATTYRIRTGEGMIDIRIGTISRSVEVLLKRSGARGGAIVTAWNPGSNPTEPAINEAANRRLKEEIHRRGRVSLETLALPDTDSWLPEPGFLILGLDCEEARTLATDYGQNAFVQVLVGSAPRLVTTALMTGIEC